LKHSHIDKYSNIKSPVHKLDPALKLILVFLLILCMVSEPRGRLLPFGIYAVVIFSIMFLSKVPMPFIIRRVSIALPFIVMAAVFFPVSVMISGHTVSWTLSDASVLTGLSIFLKASLSVLLLVLLVSTENFHHLLGGLRRLKMPVIICTISALMYKYVFIFSDEAMKTTLARQSRTPGKLKISKYKVYGNQMALIFLRSWSRSKTIYDAMLSRGFQGEFYSMQEKNIRKSDIIIFCIFAILFICIRFMTEIRSAWILIT